MKRFFAALFSVCLMGIALVGCSGSSANYNVSDVASSVAAVCNIQNPSDYTADDLTFTVSIPAELYEEFAGQYTTVNGQSGAVLVVKAASGKVDDVKAAMEAYRDGLVAQFETYKEDFPVGYEQNKQGRVVTKVVYAVMALAGADVSYDDVDKAIDEALK